MNNNICDYMIAYYIENKVKLIG